jgi:hypothetical protein
LINCKNKAPISSSNSIVEAFFAVADEAKKDGISFAGHVPTAVTASEASAAGQKSIEHIIYSSLALDCSSEDAELHHRLLEAAAKRDRSDAAVYDDADKTFSPEKAAALWTTFNRNGTWVTPTLYSISIVARSAQQSPELSLNDPLLAYVPLALQKEWRPTGPPSQKELADAAWWQRQYENERKLTGKMHRAGVRLLAGREALHRTDFPRRTLSYELHGWSPPLTPQEALQPPRKIPRHSSAEKMTERLPQAAAPIWFARPDPSEEICSKHAQNFRSGPSRAISAAKRPRRAAGKISRGRRGMARNGPAKIATIVR